MLFILLYYLFLLHLALGSLAQICMSHSTLQKWIPNMSGKNRATNGVWQYSVQNKCYRNFITLDIQRKRCLR